MQAAPLASSLEVLLRLSEHPAQRVAMAVAPLLAALLKQPAAQTSPHLMLAPRRSHKDQAPSWRAPPQTAPPQRATTGPDACV